MKLFNEMKSVSSLAFFMVSFARLCTFAERVQPAKFNGGACPRGLHLSFKNLPHCHIPFDKFDLKL